MGAFTAHCAKGHDRITFDGDREGFVRHMTTVHKRRKISTPRTTPTPWRAPKAPEGTEKLTAVLLAANGEKYTRGLYRMPDPLDPDWHTPERVPPAELRAGDVFDLEGHTYTVLDTDPERGHFLRLARSGREAWVSEWRYKGYRKQGEPVETVTLISRGAGDAAA